MFKLNTNSIVLKTPNIWFSDLGETKLQKTEWTHTNITGFLNFQSLKTSKQISDIAPFKIELSYERNVATRAPEARQARRLRCLHNQSTASL